jgi:hypothetical protein
LIENVYYELLPKGVLLDYRYKSLLEMILAAELFYNYDICKKYSAMINPSIFRDLDCKYICEMFLESIRISGSEDGFEKFATMVYGNEYGKMIFQFRQNGALENEQVIEDTINRISYRELV